jgi:hypothetical protein
VARIASDLANINTLLPQQAQAQAAE